MASEFKDDHNQIGSRQLVLLSLSETLYIIIPIVLLMHYFLSAEIREVIKPYGKAITALVYFGLILVNRRKYLKQIKANEEIVKFKSSVFYYLLLLLPIILLVILFYRPGL